MTSKEHSVSLNITCRNLDLTDPIKKYATEKISNALKKFLHQDADAHLVLKVEKNRQIAEITVNSNGTHFNGKQESDDLYKALDGLADLLQQQMRKHKDKVTSHH